MAKPLRYQIEKEHITNTCFIKSSQYKYVFNWETFQEIRGRLFAYPTIDMIVDFYADLDMFTRKRIEKIPLDNLESDP